MPALKLEPMEARVADHLPEEPGWQFEPKWDGFRCIAMRQDGNVTLHAKSGKELTRYFPEIVGMLMALKPNRFILDGELAIPLGDSLSFDALQARLHPAASRIARLSRETPAVYILFDILAAPSEPAAAERPLHKRRALLEEFFAKNGKGRALRLSPVSHDVQAARAWLGHGAGSLDGVVAKRLDEPYRSGDRAMLKVKCLRTADCVVGGFRYAEGSKEIGSLLLGLYNEEGLLDHVGFTSGLSTIKKGLATKLEKLKGGKGFTGKSPGGPSRWSTERSGEFVRLKPELVVEVRYDHITGRRFRHGTKFMRWRPDKAPKQCTFEQLGEEARPAKLISEVIAA